MCITVLIIVAFIWSSVLNAMLRMKPIWVSQRWNWVMAWPGGGSTTPGSSQHHVNVTTLDVVIDINFNIVIEKVSCSVVDLSVEFWFNNSSCLGKRLKSGNIMHENGRNLPHLQEFCPTSCYRHRVDHPLMCCHPCLHLRPRKTLNLHRHHHHRHWWVPEEG